MESTVDSNSNLGLDNVFEQGECNELKPKYVQKHLEGIDKVQDSLEENIQDFSDSMPPPNKQLSE